MGTADRLVRVQRIYLFFPPEQRVCGLAMRRGGEAVLFNPRDLAFEEMNPLGQLVLRIRAEVLARQLAGSVAFRAG